MNNKIITKLKKTGFKYLIGGIIISLFSSFLLLFFKLLNNFNQVLLFCLVLLVLGLYMIFFGVKYIINIRKTYLAEKPQTLQQLEELFDNKIYEDKYVVLSEKYIAPQQNILQILELDKICWFYPYVQKMNGIKVIKMIKVFTASNHLEIVVYNKEDEQKLMDIICKFATNARVGYNQENSQYYKEVKKSYKEEIKEF